MKKALAIILTFAFLFLYACAGEEKPVVTTPDGSTTEYVPVKLTLPTTTTQPTTKPVMFSEWGSDLLPEKFPSPPNDSRNLKIRKGEHEKHENNYLSDWVRVEFTCPEHEFHTFTNSMLDLGYIGGSKRITEGTYYTNGYKGYWQDGKNIVKINSSVTNTDGTITVEIDIIPCTDNFPEALTEYFVKFNGYTAGSGSYCGHDANGTSIADRFEGSFSTYWHWDYRFSNGFIGVTLDEFESYYKSLEKEGFTGVIKASMVDDCNIISVDLTKTVGDDTYAVYLLFNQTFRTLDIAYTNDPRIYGNQ